MVFLALLSVVLMTVDHRQHHLESLRGFLAMALYPVQYLTNLPKEIAEWTGESVATRRQLLEKADSLRAENLILKSRLQTLQSLETENMRLRSLLGTASKTAEKVLVAELLSVDLKPFSRQLIINKGELHQVYIGQPVLDAEGVMGQIIHVTPASSTVLVITDPSHALPIWINRNGLRGIAVGTGAANELMVVHWPANVDAQVGDLLVTSGVGGGFPSGYPVATVTRVERDPAEPFARVIAEPMAHLEHSREVLLIWPEQRSASQSCPPASADCGSPSAAGAARGG